jgi:hypothetical protein
MGRKIKELTGNRYGRWVVLGIDEENEKERAVGDKNVRWLCQCDCGNVKSVSGAVLNKGQSQSCGCYHRERTKLPKNRSELTGQTFGSLTVVEFSHIDKSETYWQCKCDCGKDIVVRGRHLQSGGVQSCGHLEAANRDKINKRLKPFIVDNTNIALIRNDKVNARNKSGIRGVFQRSSDLKWIGKITFRKKTYRYVFNEKEDAAKWRTVMEELLFKPAIEQFNETESAGEEANNPIPRQGSVELLTDHEFNIVCTYKAEGTLLRCVEKTGLNIMEIRRILLTAGIIPDN